MSLSSKSLPKVTLTALAVGMEAFPLYSHPGSPKVFTQPQVFATHVLKVFYRTDYRGIEQQLCDIPALRQRIRVASCQQIFHRASARGQKGLNNPYYQTTTSQRFPKLAVLADRSNHLVLAMRTGRGPSPDHAYLPALLDRVPLPLWIEWALTDAGHDSQANHEYGREHHGIGTIIPPLIGRPTSKPPSGRYRRLMQQRWGRHRRKYGQRWQSETVFSMINRNLGCELSARRYWTQSREMALLVILHDVTIILLPWGGFRQSIPDTLSSPDTFLPRGGATA